MHLLGVVCSNGGGSGTATEECLDDDVGVLDLHQRVLGVRQLEGIGELPRRDLVDQITNGGRDLRPITVVGQLVDVTVLIPGDRVSHLSLHRSITVPYRAY